MNKGNAFIEIEIQVQISNSAELLKFLEKDAEYVGEAHQIDTYYSLAHRDFIAVRPVEEWLRLRDSSGKQSINYKKWHYEEDGRSHFCDEFETVIQDISQLEKILTALDMKVLVVVDKSRRIWNYKDYEISLDSIKELGDFVEIEYEGKGAQKEPKEITAEMIDFLKQFNVGEISKNYVGYPFQLLFPDEVECERI